MTTDIAALGAAWTDFWNGDLALAGEILTPDATLLFANDPARPGEYHGVHEIAEFVGAWREQHPGLRFTLEIPPLVDRAGGDLVLRWHARYDALPEGKSGFDQLAVANGRITRIWSVTGGRIFAGHGMVSG